MNDLNENLEKINSRIAMACQAAQRDPKDVSLLAVSKQQSVRKIRQLHAAGQLAFGENYLQEALQKQVELGDLNLVWHFIGPIQSNKTKEIAQHFQWVQSVDRDKILLRLSRQRPTNLPELNVCLQVNIDREEQKSGAMPEDIPQLAQLASSLPGLKLRGLMAIPRADSTKEDGLHSLQSMRRLFCRLQEDEVLLDTLSMGMSADLEQAIVAGSTMVRIGTDLFGARD